MITLDYVECIVTRPRGSWRFQDAFAVSDYRLQPGPKGLLLWRHTGRSRKFSKPQMTRARQSGWLTWDRASVPERPHNLTLENHPASPYNQDN